jgi:hypothetical protein
LSRLSRGYPRLPSEKGAKVEQTVKSDRSDQTTTARDAASRVKDEAQHEAGQVMEEAKEQGRQLYSEAKDRIEAEAQQQTNRVAQGIRSFSGDLRSMAEQADTETSAASWARQGAGQLEGLANRIEDGGFEGLVDDVSRFARRNPGTFLAIALGAGILAGRIARNVGGDPEEGYRDGQFDGRGVAPTGQGYPDNGGSSARPAASKMKSDEMGGAKSSAGPRTM